MEKFVFHSQFTVIATGMLFNPVTGHNGTIGLRVAGRSGGSCASAEGRTGGLMAHRPFNRLGVIFISFFVIYNLLKFFKFNVIFRKCLLVNFNGKHDIQFLF